MMKINSIELKNFRGAKKLELPLKKNSIVIYGDNGCGKSTIADAIEWFVTDKVSHLSGEEIELKEALRNEFCNEDSFVTIKFSDNNINCSKTINFKGTKLSSEIDNKSIEFENYLVSSRSENLVLRYRDLTKFVESTKKDKLNHLSNIIGYSEIEKIKEVLKKSYNTLNKEISLQGFGNQIHELEGIIRTKLNASLSDRKAVFAALEKRIQQLNVNLPVLTISDIDSVLKEIESTKIQEISNEFSFLNGIIKALQMIEGSAGQLNEMYIKLLTEHRKMSTDAKAQAKEYLYDLIVQGNEILESGSHKEDTCPLCLQDISLLKLRQELKIRIKIYEKTIQNRDGYRTARTSLLERVKTKKENIRSFLENKEFAAPKNIELSQALSNIAAKFQRYEEVVEPGFSIDRILPEQRELEFNPSDFEILAILRARVSELTKTIEHNVSAILYSDLTIVRDALLKFDRLKQEQKIFETQKMTLGTVYNAFVNSQKNALESFIASFSTKINEYYQYLNPNEHIEEIKIVTIGNDNELKGLTIDFKYDGKWLTPPKKFLSESHLHCFGIAFFLASVVAFNKQNKFLVLDDVISSFDGDHRTRFSQLIFDKFEMYQIILLTHELHWFQGIVTPAAKNNQWLIKEVKWDKSNGSFIQETEAELRQNIVNRMTADNFDGLGNTIRRYLESFLKTICLNTEARVAYRNNELNEKRMLEELFSAVRSRINDKSKALKGKIHVFEKLAQSVVLSNLTSHDNQFLATKGDLKALWKDIEDFEKVFICEQPQCKKKFLSVKNINFVSKTVSCGCGQLAYDWKV